MRLTFKHIELTGASEAEVRRRARNIQRAMIKRFGDCEMQSAVDAVIDGLIEWNQG